jgi:hypothetical protein
MSVFLMFGIAALAYIGIFDFINFLTMPNSVKAIAFIVIFLALFFFVFFLINLKRGSSRKKKTAAEASAAATATAADGDQEGNREPSVRCPVGSVEVPAGVTRHQGGLLAAASRLSPPDGTDETSGIDVIYEENGVPYINSDLAKRNNQGTLNRNFIKLVESVTGSPS